MGRSERKRIKAQEIAINASNKQVLSQIKELSASKVWKQILEQNKLQETYLGKLQCTRIYFGNEFCQLLMPSINELKETVTILEERDTKFTLLTPYVTDLGLSILAPLLDFLNKRAGELAQNYEIVVNDWGVLRMMKLTYQNLSPILGRLMLKMKKDPRFSFKDYKTLSAQFHVMQQCSLTVPIYREFLRRFNIKRVELDFLEQGIDMEFNKWDLEASLHFPINYITTSRLCPMAYLSRDLEHKLKFYNTNCMEECQRYETQFVPQDRININGFPLLEYKLFYNGNTIFSIPQWTHRVPSLRTLANTGIDRIIFASKVPM